MLRLGSCPRSAWKFRSCFMRAMTLSFTMAADKRTRVETNKGSDNISPKPSRQQRTRTGCERCRSQRRKCEKGPDYSCRGR